MQVTGRPSCPRVAPTRRATKVTAGQGGACHSGPANGIEAGNSFPCWESQPCSSVWPAVKYNILKFRSWRNAINTINCYDYIETVLDQLNVTIQHCYTDTDTFVRNLSYTACTAHAPYYIVTCGLCGFTVFFHVISWTARFLSKRKVTENKICSFSTIIFETFLISSKIQRDTVIKVHRFLREVPVILATF